MVMTTTQNSDRFRLLSKLSIRKDGVDPANPWRIHYTRYNVLDPYTLVIDTFSFPSFEAALTAIGGHNV
jgi:hypothetical protein